MKLIEILPNVYGVKVPMKYYNFEIANGSNVINFKINNGFNDDWAGQPIDLGGFNVFKNDWRILGFLIKDEISFDASEFVENFQFSVRIKEVKQHVNHYKDYNQNNKLLHDIYCFTTPEQSFRSALPEEIFFENPFEEVNKNDYIFEDHPELVGNPKEYDEEKYQNDLQQYQTAQENITEKLLILQKL